MKHHRTEYLKVKIRSMAARAVFTRRKIRVARACSHCGGTMAVGSLFWRRGHRGLHVECFEELHRGAFQAHLRGVGGRRPVLDNIKQAAITAELASSAARGIDPKFREIAKAVGASERTVRRFAKGEYKIAAWV